MSRKIHTLSYPINLEVKREIPDELGLSEESLDAFMEQVKHSVIIVLRECSDKGMLPRAIFLKAQYDVVALGAERPAPALVKP